MEERKDSKGQVLRKGETEQNYFPVVFVYLSYTVFLKAVYFFSGIGRIIPFERVTVKRLISMMYFVLTRKHSWQRMRRSGCSFSRTAVGAETWKSPSVVWRILWRP